jgi:hypothetical protein
MSESSPGESNASGTVLAIVLVFVTIGGVAYWMNSRREKPVDDVAVALGVDEDDTRKVSAPPPAAPADTASESVPAPEIAAAADPARAAGAETPAAPSAPGTPTAPAVPATTAPAGSLEDVIGAALPAVVRVETNTGSGSGFFIKPDTILTNVHVVETNLLVTIRRQDGKTLSARVETTAPTLDIAVLRTSGADPSQPTLRMGSAAQARAGQEVIALGAPLGLQNTVTRGIVSAVRSVESLTLVQTDAAINPGNSGGPLIARNGDVIGITTMSMRPSAAQGLSFAVGIEHAQALLAGQRPVQNGSTPLTALNQAMNASRTSETESRRAQGEKSYERAIGEIARRADQLDASWTTFKRSCYEGRIVGAFDREWFALFEARAMPGLVQPTCTSYFTDVRRIADDIRASLVAAEEAARQADVYPGTRRDVLRTSKLDYTGWAR